MPAMPKTDPRALERGREVLRRQGRAEAVVLLVASRWHPSATIANLAPLLDVTEQDVQAALDRIRQRAGAHPLYAKTPPPPAAKPARSTARPPRPVIGPDTPGAVQCGADGCGTWCADLRGLRAHERSHLPPEPCPLGCGALVQELGRGVHVARWCPNRETAPNPS